jgi:hypothetical protein
MIKFKLLIALAAVALSAGAAPALAQQTSPLSEPSLTTPPAPPRYTRRRIVISPSPLLYRRCVDWYELQYRPSGTVLYPQMRCWWVRG